MKTGIYLDPGFCRGDDCREGPMLSVDVRGQGMPIVFLHAFPLSRAMWGGNAAFFARHFKVITLDFPGFGSTPPSADSTLTMDHLAQEVLSTLDAMALSEPAVFVGLSMGGYVLFRLLQQAPQRVRGVVLCSTRSLPDSDAVRTRRQKTIEIVQAQGVAPLVDIMKPALFGKTVLATRHDLIHSIAPDILKSTPQGVIGVLRGMAERPDSSPLLKSLHCPALVVSGAEDTVVPTEEMKAMAEAIPGAEFQLIPQAGHLLNLEAPSAFHDLFSHFLKRSVL